MGLPLVPQRSEELIFWRPHFQASGPSDTGWHSAGRPENTFPRMRFQYRWCYLFRHNPLKEEDDKHGTLFLLLCPPFSFWYKSSLFWKKTQILNYASFVLQPVILFLNYCHRIVVEMFSLSLLYIFYTIAVCGCCLHQTSNYGSGQEYFPPIQLICDEKGK